MTSFTISKGFPDDQRAQAVALYWDAFGGKLGKILRPEPSALAFFERILNPDFALSAIDDGGRLLGLAGFKTAQGALTAGGIRDLAQVYGWFGGLWRGLMLSVLERDLEPGVLLMDGICVAPAARGMGVGTALLSAIKNEAAQTGMHAVRLDVIDTNPRARALYEREGFVPGEQTDIGPLRHVFGFRKATALQFAVDGKAG
jgi:ribosomal protein S18 acetylase RimI-like enzyme